ncbi:hypothetical protein PIB30_028745 [Stylosanthes scabra]|uniref:MADS-box domain-containing protein n=1 Tax=Stylosanthes scabra TaxID=79078 RepID=A0ABU6W9N0_9FABA|nr:hypothetical protein [Stylosanthes scabra]
MQRKEGLFKKISTFSKLCGVEACLILYDDDSSKPMTWPQEHSKVLSMIEKYDLQKNNDHERPPKIFDQEEFFKNKKVMAEAEISKLRKRFLQLKYPTVDPIFKSLDQNQVMEFIAMLDGKIEACNKRIDGMLKGNQDNNGSISNFFNFDQSQLSFMNNIPNLHHDYCFDPNVTPFVINNNGVIIDSTTNNQIGECYDMYWDDLGEVENLISESSELLLDWTDNNPLVHDDPNLENIISHQFQNVSESLQMLPPTVDEFFADEHNNMITNFSHSTCI